MYSQIHVIETFMATVSTMINPEPKLAASRYCYHCLDMPKLLVRWQLMKPLFIKLQMPRIIEPRTARRNLYPTFEELIFFIENVSCCMGVSGYMMAQLNHSIITDRGSVACHCNQRPPNQTDKSKKTHPVIIRVSSIWLNSPIYGKWKW